MPCFYFQHSGVNSSDAQVLTLYNVTEEESGEYICKVSNYIGEANQSAWLIVTRYEPTGNRHAAAQGRHSGDASSSTWKNLGPYNSRQPQLFLSSLPRSVSPSLSPASVLLTVNDAMENSQQNS